MRLIIIKTIAFSLLLIAGNGAFSQVTLVKKSFDFKCIASTKDPKKAESTFTTSSFLFTARKMNDGKFEFFLKLKDRVSSDGTKIETGPAVFNAGGKTNSVVEANKKQKQIEGDPIKHKFSMDALVDKYDSFAEKLAVLFRQHGFGECADINEDSQNISKHSEFQKLAKRLFYEVVSYSLVEEDESVIAGWAKVARAIPMFDRKAIGYNRKALNEMWKEKKNRNEINKIKRKDEELERLNLEGFTGFKPGGNGTEKGMKSIKFDDVSRVLIEYFPVDTSDPEEVIKFKISDQYKPIKDDADPFGTQDKSRHAFLFEGDLDTIDIQFKGTISRMRFYYKNKYKRAEQFHEVKFKDWNIGSQFLRLKKDEEEIDFYPDFDGELTLPVGKYSLVELSYLREEGAGFFWNWEKEELEEAREFKVERWVIADAETISEEKKNFEKGKPRPTTVAGHSNKLHWNDTLLKGETINLKTEGRQVLELSNGGKNLIQEKKDPNPFARKKEETSIQESDVQGINVLSVQMEFRNGMLENLVVLAKETKGQKRDFKFTNGLPIGFSSQKNIDYLHKYWLFEDNFDQHAIRLSDLLEYTQNLNLASKDYSPANQTITIEPHERTVLLKEKTSQLFEAKIFSDFVGFNTEEPNGLVQTEVTKKISLYTVRNTMFNWDPRILNWSHNAYVEPALVISKVEKNNRALIASHKTEIINGKVNRKSFVSTMDLRNFENLAVGLDLNVFLLDAQQYKTEFMLDFGFRFGRTAIEDSVYAVSDQNTIVPREKPETYGVNTFRIYPKLIAELFPDSRYGLRVAYQANIMWLLDNRLTQVPNLETFQEFETSAKPYWNDRFEMTAHFKAGEKGRLFFRYTFNNQYGNWKTNFHQAQLGYSFFLTSQKQDKDESK